MIKEVTKESANVAAESEKNELAFYQRISNPVDAAEQMGIYLYKSAMMGIGTKEAGITIAWTCLSEGFSPLEFNRRYHIIQGEVTVRADYALACFNDLGGKHKIIRRDADAAIVDLVWGGSTNRFSFTWEDAQKETFVYGKKGEIKDNYATPRARMQMLWARCVSDGVRAICPKAIAGSYTPEETIDMLGIGGDGVIDAEYEVQKPEESPAATAKAPAETSPAPSNRELRRENGGISAINGELNSREAAATGHSVQPDGVTHDQLLRIKSFKEAIGYDADRWQRLISNPKLGGVTTAKDMTKENADRLLSFLAKEAEKIQPPTKDVTAAVQKDELSRWADGELAPKN